MIINHHPT